MKNNSEKDPKDFEPFELRGPIKAPTGLDWAVLVTSMGTSVSGYIFLFFGALILVSGEKDRGYAIVALGVCAVILASRMRAYLRRRESESKV